MADEEKSASNEKVAEELKKLENIENAIGGGGKGKSINIDVSKAWFSAALILIVAAYIFGWVTKFQEAGVFILLNFIIAALFWLSGLGWKGPTAFLFVQIGLPAILMNPLFPDFIIKSGSIILALPIWMGYAIFVVGKYHVRSFIFNIIFIGALALSFIFFLPATISSFTSVDYVASQQFIEQTYSYATTQISNAFTSTSQQIAIEKCVLSNELPTQADCTKKYTGEEEGDISNIKIQEVPGLSSFGMKFVGFENLGSNSITETPSAKLTVSMEITDRLPNPVTLNFACGLAGRQQGIVDKPQISVTKSMFVPVIEQNLQCEINTTRKGSPTFYFNATAQDIYSVGSKEILVVDTNTKNVILGPYFAQTASAGNSFVEYENKIVLGSKEFGPYVKARQNSLDVMVGADDMLQPIIRVGSGASSVNSPTRLLEGVDSSTEMDFVLFIKNKGTGRIASIKNVEFKLPIEGDVYFDKPNCGYSQSSTYNMQALQTDKASPMLTCKLKFRGTTYTNPQPKDISVVVTYDYIIHKEQQISIPSGQVT